ncbi:helix-turn-helix transcriptional regulator [Streptomyces lasiicapitis]|uniref:helix-turn-helix transcriptional regulator n=1 Tax=Streptomyces lasiicapitis TaxID=1923961 RepID=UPI00366238B2
MTNPTPLSREQIQVIAGLARGRTGADIAHDLNLTPETVRSQVRRTSALLGLNARYCRPMLVDYGYRSGLLTHLRPEPRQAPCLTPRMTEVLDRVRRGLPNADIAAELGLSYDTVRTHMKRLLAKLGAESRAHAVALGWQAGLLGPDVVEGRAAA